MGFSMKGPNMSISYGGESNKQQKSNLMKDNPVAKHASAMNMGKAHSKSPNYKYSDTPMELTAEGKKKILASDANPGFKKAIAESPVNKMKGHSSAPTYKTGCVSGSGSNAPYKLMGDPNKKMDRLSAKHKSLYDRFEMGQTSEAEEQRMYRLEDKMDRVGKRIKKKESPASLMGPTKPKMGMKKEMRKLPRKKVE